MATDPTDVLTTTDVMEMWLTDMSSAYAYVKDRIEKCTDAVIPKSELYADYVAYCDDKELEKEAQREVSDAIKVLGARTDARPVLGGRQQHCYQGITFKNRNPIYPDAYDQANQKKLVGD
jgi:phage/plasmid-associated DNA primase